MGEAEGGISEKITAKREQRAEGALVCQMSRSSSARPGLWSCRVPVESLYKYRTFKPYGYTYTPTPEHSSRSRIRRFWWRSSADRGTVDRSEEAKPEIQPNNDIVADAWVCDIEIYGGVAVSTVQWS